MTTAAAIMISSLITAIISTLTTVGVTVGTQEYQKSMIKKADANKATYGDLLTLIDKLTMKSKTMSAAQNNALYNKLQGIISTNMYTSGLSEDILGTIRNKVQMVKAQVEQHMSKGNAYQEAADEQARALTGMSAEERAKAKDKQGNWDLNTSAGRVAHDSEQYAQKAKEEYEAAKLLGEKYV